MVSVALVLVSRAHVHSLPVGVALMPDDTDLVHTVYRAACLGHSIRLRYYFVA